MWKAHEIFGDDSERVMPAFGSVERIDTVNIAYIWLKCFAELYQILEHLCPKYGGISCISNASLFIADFCCHDPCIHKLSMCSYLMFMLVLRLRI